MLLIRSGLVDIRVRVAKGTEIEDKRTLKGSNEMVGMVRSHDFNPVTD